MSAAVALVLRGEELLFIRRPVRAGDRWSGNLAFPGGLAKPGETPAAAARREAFEEVGLELGEPLAQLHHRRTMHPARLRPMRVHPFVFRVEHAALEPSPREVAEAFWVPLSRIARLPIVPALRSVGPVPIVVPSLDLDGRTLWGLSYAMVRELRARICTPDGRARMMRP